jgi:hypothetical protein
MGKQCAPKYGAFLENLLSDNNKQFFCLLTNYSCTHLIPIPYINETHKLQLTAS